MPGVEPRSQQIKSPTLAGAGDDPSLTLMFILSESVLHMILA